MGKDQDDEVLGERAQHVVIGRHSSGSGNGSGSGMQRNRKFGQMTWGLAAAGNVEVRFRNDVVEMVMGGYKACWRVYTSTYSDAEGEVGTEYESGRRARRP